MNPIYRPKGRAGEYGDLAINIYTGCNHGCVYCYARKMAERFGRSFSHVEPRRGIVEAVKRQLVKEHITGQIIHFCFTCDPYPADIDTTVTREAIKAIKESGNHVQILTKGGDRALRDFDLLDSGDWFGVTLSGASWEVEPKAAFELERVDSLRRAHQMGINTWASCEPVYTPKIIYHFITLDFIDIYKIGKLNYAPSEINWAEFGRECERLCQENGRNYYLKEDLRACMK